MKDFNTEGTEEPRSSQRRADSPSQTSQRVGHPRLGADGVVEMIVQVALHVVEGGAGVLQAA